MTPSQLKRREVADERARLREAEAAKDQRKRAILTTMRNAMWLRLSVIDDGQLILACADALEALDAKGMLA